MCSSDLTHFRQHEQRVEILLLDGPDPQVDLVEGGREHEDEAQRQQHHREGERSEEIAEREQKGIHGWQGPDGSESRAVRVRKELSQRKAAGIQLLPLIRYGPMECRRFFPLRERRSAGTTAS